MKKKRIMAAGLAVIMAFTGTGCQKILKGEPAETTSKESQEADAATKESVNEVKWCRRVRKRTRDGRKCRVKKNE